MKPEIEAVFLDINKGKIRTKLESLGARLITPERKMIRTVFSSFTRPRELLRPSS